VTEIGFFVKIATIAFALK